MSNSGKAEALIQGMLNDWIMDAPDMPSGAIARMIVCKLILEGMMSE